PAPEATRLPAVAKNRDRLALERLANEVRQYHAVAAGLSRADGVEEAQDDHRHLLLVPVGESEPFVQGLRAGGGPAGACGRAETEVVVLGERHLRALAVHFGRRGEDDYLLLF